MKDDRNIMSGFVRVYAPIVLLSKRGANSENLTLYFLTLGLNFAELFSDFCR